MVHRVCRQDHKYLILEDDFEKWTFGDEYDELLRGCGGNRTLVDLVSRRAMSYMMRLVAESIMSWACFPFYFLEETHQHDGGDPDANGIRFVYIGFGSHEPAEEAFSLEQYFTIEEFAQNIAEKEGIERSLEGLELLTAEVKKIAEEKAAEAGKGE